MRTAVYEDIPGEQREELHARAAAMLARGGANVDAIAAHLLGAAPNADGLVVQTLREAARVALARGAPEAAVRYLRRALLEPPSSVQRADVLAELGRAEMVARDPLATEHLQAALDATHDPLDRARVGADLADTVLFLGQRDRVFTLLRAAVTDVGDRDPDLALRLEGKLVSAAVAIDGAGSLAPTRNFRDCSPGRGSGATARDRCGCRWGWCWRSAPTQPQRCWS